MNNIQNKYISTQTVEKWLKTMCKEQVVIKNLNLYQKAFVHKSFLITDSEGDLEGDNDCVMIYPRHLLTSNERLEFLGDAVINLVVADYLETLYPNKDEGFLTKLRTKIVRSEKLAHFAENLGFRDFLLVSTHIERITKNGSGRNNPRFLEDSFEAFVGALYKDQNEKGFLICQKFIHGILECYINLKELIEVNDNFKDSLLRFYQTRSWVHPVYHGLSCINNKEFVVMVTVKKDLVTENSHIKKFTEKYNFLLRNMSEDDKPIFEDIIKNNNVYVIDLGKGSNKKAAEQDASKNALLFLGVSLNY